MQSFDGMKISSAGKNLQYFTQKTNKTTSYHRRIFWPQILVNMPFDRIKTLFFSKKTHHILSTFFKFNLFLIFGKKIHNWGGKEIISFDTHSKLLRILKKIAIFLKNPSIQKTQILYILRSLTISVAFYGQFVIIWWFITFTFRIVIFISILPNTDVYHLARNVLSVDFSFHT